MTQLPEVEVIRKDLEREIVGKRFKDVEVKTASLVTRQRNRPDFYRALDGRKIEGVSRRGTALLFELDDGTTLVVKFGSEASMTRETATSEPGKDAQMVAVFTTGGAIHYTDVNKDGELFVVPTDQLGELPELAPSGIDPLADTFTWHAFSQELIARRRRLKPLLIDPTFMVGLGNLYADEILWGAGLSGSRPSNQLSAQEVRRLYRAVLEVLYEAVKQGGTAEVPQGDEEEDSGDYGDYIKVYGRKGLPCPRCRQPIQVTRIEKGVDSYHCPQCQA